LKLRIRRFS
ncbi:hypothetical protein D047_1211B, partial [Vibrio parahaemolyticus VPTS-2010_2]